MNPTALEQARSLLAAGDLASAEAALRAHGDQPDCAVALRELLVAERRDDEAASIAAAMAKGSDPEAAVSRSLLAFQRGDLPAALRESQAALAQAPGLATALNHAGRALHNAGRTSEAVRAFQQAVQSAPSYAEGWASLGHAQRATGAMEASLEAYRNALDRSPGLTQVRHNLGITLYHVDQPAKALAEFDRVLSDDPDHAGALVDGALTLMLIGRLDEAQARLERALETNPDLALAHLYLGQLHNELTATDTALVHLRRSAELDPTDVETWIELTGVLEQSNRENEAIEALRQGFAADPQHPGLHLEGAKLERRRNDSEAAVRRLRGIDSRSLTPRVAQQYWFELGLNLDRAGQPDAAVDAFGRGNALARQGPRSRAMDPRAFEARCAALDAWLASGLPGARPDPADSEAGRGLAFLVGFPRSGTTLVDTTLATSPQIDALEEAPTLDRVIRALEQSTPPYPEALATLDTQQVAECRQRYAEAVRTLLGRAPGDLLIDKMPLRFLHAGLIQRLFPAAKLVFVARHPCDVVLSNFMQQYAVNETNIHFDTLTNAASTYTRIMGLWARLETALDLPALTVRYEDLVDDLPGALAPVCNFLSVDPDSVSFRRDDRLATRDRVRTSSYAQVAEPIYQRASGRWQSYRSHLAPFLDALRPHAERYGYDLNP
ncbi:MAG: sulfotransferase [Pseudomonadota bacterium]